MAYTKVDPLQKKANLSAAAKRNAAKIDPETGLTVAQLRGLKCSATKIANGPNIQAIEKRRRSMAEVQDSGLSKLEESALKRTTTMSTAHGDGQTLFKRAAISGARNRRRPDGTFVGSDKTDSTKKSDVDENGLNAYDRAAIKAAITKYGAYGDLNRTKQFRRYRNQVLKITLSQPLNRLEYFDRRGAVGKVDDPHHIDHIVSVAFGFVNNVPPEIIGNISNLRMLPAKLNQTKGARCDMSLEHLLQLIQNVAISWGAAESKPQISNMPASFGSAIVNSDIDVATTTDLAFGFILRR